MFSMYCNVRLQNLTGFSVTAAQAAGRLAVGHAITVS